jgi:GMP synthase-like glutamine amidotransferase
MTSIRKIRIAILDMNNGVQNEGMRCIKKIVQEFGEEEALDLDTHIFDVRQQAEVPDLSFDIYISSGGPGTPYPEGHLWEKKFFGLLDSLWKYNKGVCTGKSGMSASAGPIPSEFSRSIRPGRVRKSPSSRDWKIPSGRLIPATTR